MPNMWPITDSIPHYTKKLCPNFIPISISSFVKASSFAKASKDRSEDKSFQWGIPIWSKTQIGNKNLGSKKGSHNNVMQALLLRQLLQVSFSFFLHQLLILIQQ